MAKIKKKGKELGYRRVNVALTISRHVGPSQELHHPYSGCEEAADIFARLSTTMYLQR
jgi:hypothetical protein